MKIICISLDAGWFGNKDGLTIGKTYQAYPVVLSMSDVTDENNIKFLIYNDNNEWRTYRKRLFKPLE